MLSMLSLPPQGSVTAFCAMRDQLHAFIPGADRHAVLSQGFCTMSMAPALLNNGTLVTAAGADLCTQPDLRHLVLSPSFAMLCKSPRALPEFVGCLAA